MGNYLKVGDKVVEVDRFENGVPVIKARSETIRRPDGTQNVIVHVPCLRLSAKPGRKG